MPAGLYLSLLMRRDFCRDTWAGGAGGASSVAALSQNLLEGPTPPRVGDPVAGVLGQPPHGLFGPGPPVHCSLGEGPGRSYLGTLQPQPSLCPLPGQVEGLLGSLEMTSCLGGPARQIQDAQCRWDFR